jgi:hypothetical protein
MVAMSRSALGNPTKIVVEADLKEGLSGVLYRKKDCEAASHFHPSGTFRSDHGRSPSLFTYVQ